MSIEVRQIDESNLKEFIKLPFRLYKNDPNWVPPLISEMKSMLNADKNVFLQSQHAFFIAYRDGKPAARILAGYNEPVSKTTGISNGYFSLFEADDEESGAAVLEAAETYLRNIGTVKMFGPYSPTDGEENRALLVEGFDSPPVLYAAYNPEWYMHTFEEFGLKKSSDLLAFKIDTGKMPIEKFRKIVGYAKKKFGFEAYPLNLSQLESELMDIQSILKESAIDDWDTGIPSWDLIVQSAEAMKTLADPELVYIVRHNDGRPIAFVVCIPNFNEVLKHMNGRLLPFGFIKFLYWKNRISGLRVLMQFCIKEYERKAAVSAAYLGIMEAALKKGYDWGDASTIGEENYKSWRAVVGAGGRQYRRFRWYVKEF
ncbi:MAG: hypothetical protein JXN65_12090 [Clostridia bacterium]|nr:hypothetical protein [Clostridia bacterium]